MGSFLAGEYPANPYFGARDMSEKEVFGANPGDRDVDEPSSGFRGSVTMLMAGFLLLVLVGGVLDLMLYAPDGIRSLHVLFQLCMVAWSLTFALVPY